MRPWLVVIGVIFLTLASGTLTALYFGGGDSPTVGTTPTFYRFSIAANETVEVTFNGSTGTTENFVLSWQSSVPIHVVLEEPLPCYLPCPNGAVFAIWPSNMSGSWSGSGPFHFPLQCFVQDVQSRPANVALTGRAVSSSPTRLSFGVELVLAAGGAGLFIVGGLAVFLGLFLKGNPYGPRPPIISRSADDVDEIVSGGPPIH